MLNRKKVYIILAAIMALMVIIEVLWAHPHHHMIWNTVPGFDLIIGFAGGWALIILAKIIMAKLLQREENYYDEKPESIQEENNVQGGGHHA